MHVIPEQIRSNLDIVANPDIFYNMMHDTIHEMKYESSDDLVSRMRVNGYSSKMSKWQDGTSVIVSVIDRIVSGHSYAADILITDDTTSSNIAR